MDPIYIESKYSGGNIKVVAVDDNSVRLEQDIRDTTVWWFYWSFRAISPSEDERDVVFEFANGEVVGAWGPAVSEDGISWRWLGKESLISRSSFRYRFTADRRSVYFAFSLPYQEHHFERFYATIAADPRVRREVLTLSEELRSVPLLLIGNPDADKHIVLTSRHHACESTASYLLEGLLAYYLAQPQSPILDQYRIHCIPFVDIDGVENGDQGKSRAPHDHNRDYIDVPLYRSTAAIIDYAGKLPLTAGIDFHCPGKWGRRDDTTFIVKQYSPVKEEIERLSGHLQRITSNRTTPGAIRHHSSNDLDMGVEWNQPHGENCSAFFARCGAKLAFTFEMPYFGNGEHAYTADGSRLFGADVAAALEQYLLECP
ncbi:MAG: hypothetical protein K0R28_4588 [Paenibacillus sp.]|jgi:hypothetical protein|nr:hypothetical protein [Paenibacillus sp.]